MLTRAAARAIGGGAAPKPPAAARPKTRAADAPELGTAALLSTEVAAAASEQPRLAVEHDTDGCEMFIKMPNCDERAYLQYERKPDGVLDLQHTVVPEAFRGRGVAKILAKAAFDYVVEQDTKMKLTCWYLQKYIKDNPSLEHVSRVVQ